MHLRTNKIYLPWWQASYIPLNGFHPLYSFVCAKPEGIELLTLDARSIDCVNLSRNSGSIFFCGPKNKFLKKVYDDFYVKEEYFFNAKISGISEFHHTCPPLYISNPFYFHFESFLPIFMPYAFQGQEFVFHQRLNLIREAYKELFESEKCLGIVSHINTSLEEFSQFFNSEIIQKKIQHIPIGYLPASESNEVGIDGISDVIEKCKNHLTFIFNNSSSQYDESFVLRGGAVALKLALEFIKKGHFYKFIFRCAKPSQTLLKNYNIDEMLLLKYEGISIFWINNYLCDFDMNRLYACADFNLLISANLHSSSILRSMHHGCIPIISDTRGTEEYVSDFENCILINGVKEQVWTYSEKYKYWYDEHDIYKTTKFIDQLTKVAFDKVSAFCAEKDKKSVAENCKSYVREVHDPKLRAKELFNFFKLNSTTAISYPSHPNNSLIQLDNYKFLGRTSPSIFCDIGDRFILEFQRIYYVVRKNDLIYPNRISLFSKTRFPSSTSYDEIVSLAFNDYRKGVYDLVAMIKIEFPDIYKFLKISHIKTASLIYNISPLYYLYLGISKFLKPVFVTISIIFRVMKIIWKLKIIFKDYLKAHHPALFEKIKTLKARLAKNQ
jgi:hypothetical protein